MTTITCDCGATFPAHTGASSAVGNQPLRSHPTCPRCGARWVYDPESGQSWQDDTDEDAT